MAEKKQRKAPTKRAKKSWQRPQIKSGQLFESSSLACSKVFPDGSGGMCEAGGIPQVS